MFGLTTSPLLILLASYVAAWMTQLVPERVPCAWRDTFPSTATSIARAALNARDPVARAADLTAVAYYESSFRPDAIGDAGASVGLFQVHPFGDVTKDMLLDPDQAARVAEHLLSKSERRCAMLERPTDAAYLGYAPREARWALYTSGDPTCERGRNKARSRYLLARNLERTVRP